MDRAQEFDDACEEAAGDLLGQISTVDTAHDLERIRIALGETTISYMGFSYGSELGAMYATLFPENVRAMVLDGAIDPDLDSVETARAQAIGTEHALDAFLDDCSSHSTCAFHNNGDAEGAYDALIAELDTDPLPPPERGRPEVGQGVALNAVIQALYSTDFWPALAEALDDAQHGDGDGLLALNDTYLERDDDGTWTNTLEAFIAIGCLDDPAPRDLDAYAELADEFEQVAPRLGRSFASGYYCALWPVESQPGPSVDGAGRAADHRRRHDGRPVHPARADRGAGGRARDRSALGAGGRRAHRLRRGQLHRRPHRRLPHRPHRPRRRHPLLTPRPRVGASRTMCPPDAHSVGGWVRG